MRALRSTGCRGSWKISLSDRAGERRAEASRNKTRQVSSGFWIGVVAAACARVETEAPRAERDNLQKAAGHGDVLEEMHKLVLVGDIGVKQNSGRDAVRGQHRGSEARAITQDQRDAASEFDEHRYHETELRKRQSNGRNSADRCGRHRDLPRA
jgi:hypothetical protein